MNLCNGKSGDWDVLAENTNMIIGDTNEDYGLDLTLFFGEFGEAIIPEPEIEVQIGKVPEYVIIPFHQFLVKIEGDLVIPTEEQILTAISMPLRLTLRREQKLVQINMPLELVCDEPLLIVQMPIRLFPSPLRQELVVIKMALRTQGLVQEDLFSAYRPINSVKMRQKKRQRRKKQTKIVAEI